MSDVRMNTAYLGNELRALRDTLGLTELGRAFMEKHDEIFHEEAGMTIAPKSIYPDTSGQREKVASEIETVGWAILQALHEGVEDGPQSWIDMASDQEKRIKKAAIAAIEAVTDLAQFNAQGFSWPPQPLAPAQGSGDCGVLWCCHVRGPDDVYAAPDYVTALAWSDLLNEMNWRSGAYPKSPRFKNPESYSDCLVKAVPAPWPHSAESHAEDLPKSIQGFALTSTDRGSK